MNLNEICEPYGMTEVEYTVMRQKIVDILKEIEVTPKITQPKVYELIECAATSKKEAVMITAGVCAVSWDII
jgi:hypothetical protein